jgi:hypothetical protein
MASEAWRVGFFVWIVFCVVGAHSYVWTKPLSDSKLQVVGTDSTKAKYAEVTGCVWLRPQ